METQAPPAAVSKSLGNSAIAARGLNFAFGEGELRKQILFDVSFDVAPGEVVLLTGPSGSGKTTLLSLIGGLLPPSAGTIETDGIDLTRLDQRALTAFRLRHLGIVFQAFHLIDALTVVENVELPLTLAGVRRPESRQRAMALVDRFGLASRAGFLPRSLSGGEQQRTAIARALVADPPIVLADEPTGSLDASAGEAVVTLLHAEAARHGRAVIVASHDPRLLERAGRVVRMDFGRVVGG